MQSRVTKRIAGMSDAEKSQTMRDVANARHSKTSVAKRKAQMRIVTQKRGNAWKLVQGKRVYFHKTV